MTLLLKRTAYRLTEEYEVVCGRETIGTIFKHPGYDPWHWSIWRFRVHERCHGTTSSRSEAMAALAAVWRSWLAREGIREPEKDEPFDVPMDRYKP